MSDNPGYPLDKDEPVDTLGRHRTDEVERCKNCGHPIRACIGTSTGWEHFPSPPDPTKGWQGVRCPGRLTGAEPIEEQAKRWECCHIEEGVTEHEGALFELTLSAKPEDNTLMCLGHLPRYINRDNTTQISPVWQEESGNRVFPGDLMEPVRPARNNIDASGRLERLPREGEFYTRSRDGVKIKVTRTKAVNKFHPHDGADVEYVKNGETRKQWVFFSNFSRTYQWSEHQGWE